MLSSTSFFPPVYLFRVHIVLMQLFYDNIMTLTHAVYKFQPTHYLQRAGLNPSATFHHGDVYDLPMNRQGLIITVLPTRRVRPRRPRGARASTRPTWAVVDSSLQVASSAAPFLFRMSNALRAYKTAVEFHPGPTVFSPHRDSAWPGADQLLLYSCMPSLNLRRRLAFLRRPRSWSAFVLSTPEIGIGCTVLGSSHCLLR